MEPLSHQPSLIWDAGMHVELISLLHDYAGSMAALYISHLLSLQVLYASQLQTILPHLELNVCR